MPISSVYSLRKVFVRVGSYICSYAHSGKVFAYSGNFAGIFFADFGIHPAVILKIWVYFRVAFLSRVPYSPSRPLIAVSFGVNFLFRTRLSAILSDPHDLSNGVVCLYDRYFSPGIFLYFMTFGIHSGIFFTICRYISRFIWLYLSTQWRVTYTKFFQKIFWRAIQGGI